MFNPKKRVLMNVNATAQEWIEELQKLPPETPISICGAYNGYIHVETDEDNHPTSVTIDCEPLDEDYPEDAFDDEDDDDD